MGSTGPKRNENYGGLSVRLVFSRSPDALHNLEDEMRRDVALHELWRKHCVSESDAEAALDSLFLDHPWHNAPDRLWRLFLPDGEACAEAKTFYENSAAAACALLAEMERRWAPPSPTHAGDTGVAPLDVDYKTAFFNAHKLLGKGNEAALMAYLGTLWRSSPGLAAATLAYAQRVTAEFYRTQPETN